MPTRFRKIRRQRGSRTHGWGQVGQHRQSGSKGGTGKAGLHKHKWSWTVKYAPNHFGHDAFKPPHQVKTKKWINVGQLDTLYTTQSVESNGNIAKIDLVQKGYDKLLGAGSVSNAYSILVRSFTTSAKAKIEKAGGTIVKG